jgi:hypothetical protein
MLYTVWVGGTEICDEYLNSLEDAQRLADEYRDEGYDDVVIMWQPESEEKVLDDLVSVIKTHHNL